jgi:ATP-dependent DNA ligase
VPPTSAWAFDLMALNWNDLRIVALEDRKRRLGHLIARSAISRLLHSEAFDDGERLLAECGKRGLEGVVAKHKASVYRSGRATSWVKVKCPAWQTPTAIVVDASDPNDAQRLRSPACQNSRRMGARCRTRRYAEYRAKRERAARGMSAVPLMADASGP